MENGQLKTVYHPVGALIFAEYNPRQLTKDQYKSLRDSMERFGLVDPVIINKHPDRENIVIGGHQRLRIAKDMGIDKVPCVELSLDLNQEKELNVRLNRNVGEWDYDALANYFDVGELTEWGFTEDELQFWMDEPTEGLIEDDEIPEVEEAVTQAGDLWLLGEHRVLCGDATKKEDVERLMDGGKVESVVTDPPYGMDFQSNYKKAKHRKIDGDGNESLLKIACETDSVFSKYIFCRWENLASIPKPKSIIVWVKNNWSMGDLEHEHARQTELIVFYSGKNHRWAKERPTDFIEARRTGNKLHPTQKPVELIVYIIGWCIGSIFEPFLGSGSTLIACEKTGRKCYGMEIDPHYCDVIVKRWEEFTGKEALRMESVRC